MKERKKGFLGSVQNFFRGLFPFFIFQQLFILHLIPIIISQISNINAIRTASFCAKQKEENEALSVDHFLHSFQVYVHLNSHSAAAAATRVAAKATAEGIIASVIAEPTAAATAAAKPAAAAATAAMAVSAAAKAAAVAAASFLLIFVGVTVPPTYLFEYFDSRSDRLGDLRRSAAELLSKLQWFRV